MIADCTDLTALNDVELDRLIISLIKIPIVERTHRSELLGQSASKEWERRYPETVSPSFYEYAMERGGFPPCYSGSRKTVVLEHPPKKQEENIDEE